jgi:hypothetical protein
MIEVLKVIFIIHCSALMIAGIILDNYEQSTFYLIIILALYNSPKKTDDD